MNSFSAIRDINLQRRNHFHLDGPAKANIRVLQGEVWITRHGDTEDHVLAAGDVLRHQGSGATMITATKDARIRIQAADVPASFWRAVFFRLSRPWSSHPA